MKENLYGIYGIFNVTKEKWYVGKSTNVYCRLSGHKSKLNKGIEHSVELQRDFDNGDVFIFTPIETEPNFPIDSLDAKENYYINKLVMNGKVKGYNKTANVDENPLQNSDDNILSKYQQAIVVIKEYQQAIELHLSKIKQLEADKEYLISQNSIQNSHINKLIDLIGRAGDMTEWAKTRDWTKLEDKTPELSKDVLFYHKERIFHIYELGRCREDSDGNIQIELDNEDCYMSLSYLVSKGYSWTELPEPPKGEQ